MLTKEFLVGKTLKYTPDITKDIFLQILRKLESIGIKCYHKDDEAWNYFSKTHNYFADFWKSEYGFTPNKSSLEEIQVSDIIGSQFEVGKWYEIVSPNFKPGEHISKFKKSTGTQFWFSECIHFGNYLKKEDWHGYPNSVRLCTLEEIQQYLPEGHPDKVSKSLTVDDLVEGDVYYHKCLRYSYIVKFKKLDGISITGEYYIDLETNNYYKNYRNTSITELRSATPAEKKWLLTCIKQDKFIKQSELDKYDDEGNLISEFKVGDWVVWRENFEKIPYLLTYLDENKKGFKVDHNCGDYLSCNINELCRLATPEEIDKVTKPIKTGKGILEAAEVNRNVYYEVSNQEQYNEILDWLRSKGEKVCKGAFIVNDKWRYVHYYINTEKWYLDNNKQYLPKAEFKFKNTSNKCGVCEGKGGETRDGFCEPCPECNGEGYVEEKIIEPKQSHRKIPTVEKVTNRFKASPVRKRNLPEIF